RDSLYIIPLLYPLVNTFFKVFCLFGGFGENDKQIVPKQLVRMAILYKMHPPSRTEGAFSGKISS
ncbi:MAG: hypothetical protein ACI3XI_05005, partial [Eubacteriales bacterium]